MLPEGEVVIASETQIWGSCLQWKCRLAFMQSWLWPTGQGGAGS